LHTEKGSCRFVEVEVAFSPETNGDHCRGGLLPLEMEEPKCFSLARKS